jgi:hypothetical protein
MTRRQKIFYIFISLVIAIALHSYVRSQKAKGAELRRSQLMKESKKINGRYALPTMKANKKATAKEAPTLQDDSEDVADVVNKTLTEEFFALIGGKKIKLATVEIDRKNILIQAGTKGFSLVCVRLDGELLDGRDLLECGRENPCLVHHERCYRSNQTIKLTNQFRGAIVADVWYHTTPGSATHLKKRIISN